MKFNIKKPPAIFTALILLFNASFADQVVINYSGIWPNTLNGRWDQISIETNKPYSTWMQFYAKEDPKSPDQCVVYCGSVTSDLVGKITGFDSLRCSVFELMAHFSDSYNGVYNQLRECSIENGKVVWPIYNEIYNSGKEKTLPVNLNDEDLKPMQLTPIKKPLTNAK